MQGFGNFINKITPNQSRGAKAAVILVFAGHYLNASKLSYKYIDAPVFNLLPNDSITEVFRVFGESKIYKTPLAHNYVLYYDYGNKVGLIFCIYQSGNEHIWEIMIRKECPREVLPLKETIREFKSGGIIHEYKRITY
jgi:hypothetical protein